MYIPMMFVEFSTAERGCQDLQKASDKTQGGRTEAPGRQRNTLEKYLFWTFVRWLCVDRVAGIHMRGMRVTDIYEEESPIFLAQSTSQKTSKHTFTALERFFFSEPLPSLMHVVHRYFPAHQASLAWLFRATAPPPAPAISSAAALVPEKTCVLRSKIGNGHGTPVAAQPVMMARYLVLIISKSFQSRSNPVMLGAGVKFYSPTTEACRESEASADLGQVCGLLQPLDGGVVAGDEVCAGEAAEEGNEAEDGDAEGYICAEGGEEEDEADQGPVTNASASS